MSNQPTYVIPRQFNYAMEYDALQLKPGRYAVRPKGQLGTCGWSPIPWTVIYVSAKSPAAAIAWAERAGYIIVKR